MLGNECPNCSSREISGSSPPDMDSGLASQQMACDDCGGTWTDVYTLIGYQDFEGSSE